MDRKRAIIGWREKVALPDWNIPTLVAKIDTGARTSSIHVADIREIEGGLVEFEVVLGRRDSHRHVTVQAPYVRHSRIRSSNGTVTERYVVRTTMVLAGVEKQIEVNLMSRDNMLVRMLIGRTALGDDFAIYPDTKHIKTAP
jgi:hypothetical protein